MMRMIKRISCGYDSVMSQFGYLERNNISFNQQVKEPTDFQQRS